MPHSAPTLAEHPRSLTKQQAWLEPRGLNSSAATQLCGYAAQRVNPASDRPLIQQRLVESSGVEKNTALAIGALSGAILAGTTLTPNPYP